MLSSYIITRNNVRFTVKIIDKRQYSLTDMVTEEDINYFMSFYIVEIKLENLEMNEEYLMLQENIDNIKEIDVENELLIHETINIMYMKYNEKKKN